jgi:asparagine synthase (glutamine-hydrolysing)
MCGISGFLQASPLGSGARAIIERMSLRIAHRGPDDAGHWLDPEAGIALGHRRLSIIDLSAHGHQPMISASGRHVLVYNGEIYNHAELRRELEGLGAAPPWRGRSDAEVLLEGLEHWGLEDCLARLNGMFAFALWDRRNRRLSLARDRLGEKPLYYGRVGSTFLFGSELKALTAYPGFPAEVDREALALYLFLRHKYIPAPWSIWKGIRKLHPGHCLVVGEDGRQVSEPRCYWDFPALAQRGVRDPLPAGPELEERLDALLRDAVARRMIADVPLGALLSGGTDSSTVVALMQAQSERPVRTFSVGFAEKSHDEAPHARAVAEHLGTEHADLCVTPAQALAVVPELPRYWDEPFADSSQIPTRLLCEMARRHVTVALSGDGGDELFGGYRRYTQAARLWRLHQALPDPVRRALARFLPSAPAALLRADSPEELYRALISKWKYPESVVLGAHEPEALLAGLARPDPPLPDFRQLMMYVDTLTYLPDDVLVKVDRASMSLGLEVRVPLLDHRVVELAWRLPVQCKFRRGEGKQILRRVLHRYVPPALVERPKMGFRAPIAAWLRGPFRDWAEELLAERRLREEGYFDPVAVRRIWAVQQNGGRGHGHIWAILMFQAWLEHQRGAAGIISQGT